MEEESTQKIIEEGTALIANFKRFSDYTSRTRSYTWPNKEDISPDFNKAIDLIRQIPDKIVPETKLELVLQQLKIALRSRLLYLKPTILSQSIVLKDHLQLFDIEEQEFDLLEKRLHDNVDTIRLLTKERYKNDYIPESFKTPNSPSIRNNIELKFKTCLGLLEKTGLEFYKDFPEMSKDLSSFSLILDFDIPGSFTSGLQRQVYFCSDEFTYFDEGEAKIDMVELTKVYVHEVLGHCIHRALSTKNNNLPDFLKVPGSSWAHCTREGIAFYIESLFVQALEQNPKMINTLDTDISNDIFITRMKESRALDSYNTDLDSLLFSLYCKHIEQPEKLSEQDINNRMESLIVSNTSYNRSYTEIRSLFTREKKLWSYGTFHIVHSYHGIETLVQE